MDADLWSSRIAAAKKHYTTQQQSSQLDRLSMDEYEVEEESRKDFPCPYCYEDHDIASLCSHLEDEHLFELKVAICPICLVKVSRDLHNHITVQHRRLLKMQRHRRLRRVAIPNNQALSLLSRDLREAHLQVLLASGGFRSNNNDTPASVPDSLLSSLVFNFPTPEVEESPKPIVSTVDEMSKESNVPSKDWESSCDSSLTYEERQQRVKQAAARACFVQGLLLSTLFDD